MGVKRKDIRRRCENPFLISESSPSTCSICGLSFISSPERILSYPNLLFATYILDVFATMVMLLTLLCCIYGGPHVYV